MSYFLSIYLNTREYNPEISKNITLFMKALTPDTEFILISPEEKLILYKKDFAQYNYPGLKYYSFKGEKNSARNFGWSKSRGKYVFFVDDDMFIGRSFISNLIKYLKKHVRDAYFVPEVVKDPNTLKERIFAIEKLMAAGDISLQAPRIFRKTLFSPKYPPFLSSYQVLDEWGYNLRIQNLHPSQGHVPNGIFVTNNLSIINTLMKAYSKGKSAGVNKDFNIGKSERLNVFARIVKTFSNWHILRKDPLSSVLYLLLKSVETIFFFIGYIAGKV